VLEAAVDRLGGAVAGAGAVEVGQDVGGAGVQGPPEGVQLAQRSGDTVAQRRDELRHQRSASGAVGFAVGGDHALVDAPGRLDLDVLVAGEQVVQSLYLLGHEQVSTGVQGPPRAVERIVLAAAVPMGVLLDSPAALVEGVAGQADDVEGVHHRHGRGQLLGGGGLEPGEPVHRHDLDPRAPGLRTRGKPLLERLFRAALNHVQQPGWSTATTDRGEVDDDGDVLVAATGVPPDMLIDPDHPDPVEPGGVPDEHTAPFGQHRVVGGVPRDGEALGDAGDGEVLTHDGLQRPPQAATRQLRPRRGRAAGVLAPHMPTPGTPVAADGDQQRRRAPPQRLVRQASDHRVTRGTLAPAPATPLIGLDDTTRQHRTIRLHSLPDHLQTQLVETSERSQIRASEGSVRPLRRHRHANPRYTLN